MRLWFYVAVAIVATIAASAQAQQTPGPVGAPEGAWRTQIHWVPMTDATGATRLLYARVCRPQGEAPARAVVIAHGSPPNPNNRPTMAPPACESEAARWFLDRGFVVVAAMRRGYGATGGTYVEDLGPCGSRDFVRSGLESARDVAAIVDYAAALPYVRPQGVVLVGQSAGGWASIAYNSLPHPRVTAMVSMAGGRGSHYQNQPNNVCQSELLVDAAGRFARGSTTPMLWIYTENDSYFTPALAAAMYAAYSQNDGRAEFDQLPAYGSDGHRLFLGVGGSQIWGPLVERYLGTRPLQ